MNTRILKTLAASVIASTAALASASTASATPQVGNGAGWGNGQFNASYDIWAGIKGKKEMGTPLFGLPAYPDNYILAGGNADANVTMFGKSKTIVSAIAWAQRSGASVSAVYDLDLLGTTVASGNPASGFQFTMPCPFFSATETYFFYGIPITVSAIATGEFGLTTSATLSTNGIAINVTPSAKAYVTASAGVGTSGVSAGITGSLTAIELKLPVNVQTTFPGALTVNYTTSANLTLSSLDGSLGLYAEAPVLGHQEWDFVTWSGYQWFSHALLNQTGTLTL